MTLRNLYISARLQCNYCFEVLDSTIIGTQPVLIHSATDTRAGKKCPNDGKVFALPTIQAEELELVPIINAKKGGQA